MAKRWGWLGRTWFLAAVALLALNDHVGKARYPGWWTGKLSDLAGVVVMATLVAVVAGRRIGLVVTAAAFVVLKVVPGGAEAASPILGGVTRRDPTDLLGLLALLPLWPLLAAPAGPSGPLGSVAGSCRSSDPADRPSPTPRAVPRSRLVPALTSRWLRPSSHRGTPPRSPRPTGVTKTSVRPRAGTGTGAGTWRRVLASALPVVGALTALVATTATSCLPDPAVTEVLPRGSTVYARVGRSGTDWARSEDGGRSWEPTEAPEGVEQRPRPAPDDPPVTSTSQGEQSPTASTAPDRPDPDRPTPRGPTEMCGAGSCYRLRGQRTIERSSRGDGDWSVEHRLTEADLDELTGECSNPRRGILESVAVPDRGEAGVVSLGSGGVLAREPGGTWRPHAVLGADAGAPGPPVLRSGWFWAVVAAIPVGMAAAWTLGRRRSAERVAGVVLVPLGVGILIVRHAVDSFSSYGRLDLIIAVAVVAVAVKTSRSRRVGRALRPNARPPAPGPWGAAPGWAPPAEPYGALPPPPGPPRPPPPGPGQRTDKG